MPHPAFPASAPPPPLHETRPHAPQDCAPLPGPLAVDHPEASARAVPSAQSALPPKPWPAKSLSSFRARLQRRLLRETFPVALGHNSFLFSLRSHSE